MADGISACKIEVRLYVRDELVRLQVYRTNDQIDGEVLYKVLAQILIKREAEVSGEETHDES
jgi:hypothetical protein